MTLRDSADEPHVFGPDGEGDFAPSSALAMMGRVPKAVLMETALPVTLVTSPGMSVLSPMKVALKRVAGLGVDPFRRAFILDAALVHHDAMVGQRHGLFLVVGDMDEGGADRFWIAFNSSCIWRRSLRSSAPSGSSSSSTAGFDHQGAGQRHALALAAGKLVRLLVEGFRQADHGQRLMGQPVALARGDAPHAQAEARHCCPTLICGKQGIVLEHGGGRALGRRHMVQSCAADQHAALRGMRKPPRIESSVVLPEPDGPSSTV